MTNQSAPMYSGHFVNNALVEKALAEAIKKHNVAVEELTEKQVMEALKQAIACGDFQRLVQVDKGGQQVIYIPFQEQQRLQARVLELEEKLDKIRGFLCL